MRAVINAKERLNLVHQSIKIAAILALQRISLHSVQDINDKLFDLSVAGVFFEGFK